MGRALSQGVQAGRKASARAHPAGRPCPPASMVCWLRPYPRAAPAAGRAACAFPAGRAWRSQAAPGRCAAATAATTAHQRCLQRKRDTAQLICQRLTLALLQTVPLAAEGGHAIRRDGWAFVSNFRSAGVRDLRWLFKTFIGRNPKHFKNPDVLRLVHALEILELPDYDEEDIPPRLAKLAQQAASIRRSLDPQQLANLEDIVNGAADVFEAASKASSGECKLGTNLEAVVDAQIPDRIPGAMGAHTLLHLARGCLAGYEEGKEAERAFEKMLKATKKKTAVKSSEAAPEAAESSSEPAYDAATETHQAAARVRQLQQAAKAIHAGSSSIATDDADQPAADSAIASALAQLVEKVAGLSVHSGARAERLAAARRQAKQAAETAKRIEKTLKDSGMLAHLIKFWSYVSGVRGGDAGAPYLASECGTRSPRLMR